MADSEIAQAVRAQKAALEARDAAILRQMAKSWLDVEKALKDKVDMLADEVYNLHRAGKPVSQGKLFQLGRLQNLLVQAQSETAKYAATSAEFIAGKQAESIALGVRDASSVLTGAIGGQFDKLSAPAIEAMIAATAGTGADGAPLRKLLFERMVRSPDGNVLPGVQDRLIRTLTNGIAQGWNAKKTAKLIRNDLAEGLNKALVIARSETMRAYRTGAAEQYTRSGAVKGVVRMCAHTPLTCLACLADEGQTVYPADKPLPDHPNGRCTPIPWIKGMEKPGFEKGEAYVKSLSEPEQRALMGRGRFEAWKEGKVSFGDFATRTEHAVWGGGLQVTRIADLGVR